MRKAIIPWLNGFMGLLVVIFAGVWTVIFLDKIVMPIIVRSDLTVDVPDLRSMSIIQASQLGVDIGVEIIEGRVRVDNNHPRGTVLDQYPVAGSVVKPGRRIEVVLSTSERLILCPDIIGMSPREATLIADSSGLQIAESEIAYAHSKLVPEGVVLLQSPSSMTGMMRGDSISFTISLGTAPTHIVAPDLVGRNYDELRFVLAKNRLNLGDITRYPDKSAREGQILAQRPTAGTKMKPGEKMHFDIAIIPTGRSKENAQ